MQNWGKRWAFGFSFGEAALWLKKKRIRVTAGIAGDAGKQGVNSKSRGKKIREKRVEPLSRRAQPPHRGKSAKAGEVDK
jgi:hypothetical protein